MTSSSTRAAPQGATESHALEAGAHLHLVGLGGVGLSAAARHLRARGHEVSGTDLMPSPVLSELAALGIRASVGHDASRLPAEASCVVRSEAVDDSNPEIVAARARGIPVLRYGQLLAEISSGRDDTAVAGTHGKTTTSALLAFILREAGLEPGALIGGHVPQLGGGALVGEGRPMVLEACEYRESFLALEPRHAILTNVDDDHLDHYGNEERLRGGFRRFAGRVRRGGLLVTTASVARDLDLRGAARCRMLTLGPKRRDVRVRVERDDSFSLLHPDGRRTPRMTLELPGHHNIMNAAMAAVTAERAYGVDRELIADAVSRFGGVCRRFDVLRDGADAVVVDDYAHHPTELEATLLTARRRYAGRRILVVFQPHLASRTRRHFPGFLNALAHADRCIVVDDYAVAGRDEGEAVGARRLFEALRSLHMPCARTTLANAPETVLANIESGDVVVVCGAGDVGEASRELAQRLR